MHQKNKFGIFRIVRKTQQLSIVSKVLNKYEKSTLPTSDRIRSSSFPFINASAHILGFYTSKKVFFTSER